MVEFTDNMQIKEYYGIVCEKEDPSSIHKEIIHTDKDLIYEELNEFCEEEQMTEDDWLILIYELPIDHAVITETKMSFEEDHLSFDIDGMRCRIDCASKFDGYFINNVPVNDVRKFCKRFLDKTEKIFGPLDKKE